MLLKAFSHYLEHGEQAQRTDGRFIGCFGRQVVRKPVRGSSKVFADFESAPTPIARPEAADDPGAPWSRPPTTRSF